MLLDDGDPSFIQQCVFLNVAWLNKTNDTEVSWTTSVSQLFGWLPPQQPLEMQHMCMWPSGFRQTTLKWCEEGKKKAKQKEELSCVSSGQCVTCERPLRAALLTLCPHVATSVLLSSGRDGCCNVWRPARKLLQVTAQFCWTIHNSSAGEYRRFITPELEGKCSISPLSSRMVSLLWKWPSWWEKRDSVIFL